MEWNTEPGFCKRQKMKMIKMGKLLKSRRNIPLFIQMDGQCDTCSAFQTWVSVSPGLLYSLLICSLSLMWTLHLLKCTGRSIKNATSTV